MSIPQSLLEQSIQINIQQALQEDIGDGDIPPCSHLKMKQATASIISREDMVLAGQPWVNALISAYDNTVQVTWLKQEGDRVAQMKPFKSLLVLARSLRLSERPAYKLYSNIISCCNKNC
ncbi:hypothetical protein ABVN80_18880 [Acinetobacter baumannii]